MKGPLPSRLFLGVCVFVCVVYCHVQRGKAPRLLPLIFEVTLHSNIASPLLPQTHTHTHTQPPDLKEALDAAVRLSRPLRIRMEDNAPAPAPTPATTAAAGTEEEEMDDDEEEDETTVIVDPVFPRAGSQRVAAGGGGDMLNLGASSIMGASGLETLLGASASGGGGGVGMVEMGDSQRCVGLLIYFLGGIADRLLICFW